MNRGDREPTDSSEASSFFPRSTSTVSLHERFSQVLVDQRSLSRRVTLDPVVLQQQEGRASPQVVLLVEAERSCPRCLPHSRRRSVWTRLGWQQGTSRPPGFWSFMNKYRWRTRPTSTCRRPGNLYRPLGKRRLVRRTKVSKIIGRTHLQRGGVISSGRRCMSKDRIPTKQQLDAQLDEYMSMTKSRLDAQLDEYMSMTGSTHWD